MNMAKADELKGLTTRGVAPIAPDEPFDEAAYDAVIAAMDELIAADTRPVEEARYTEKLHPRGRAGRWIRKLGSDAEWRP
jgi:hypothetical protein